MRRPEQGNIAVLAKGLLSALQQRNEPRSAALADDLLLFFYRLRDEHRIIQSSSSRFKGPSFSFLHELLYQLESRPDETLLSPEWRALVELLLSDISSGRIVVANK
jgi:hypothetical protein